MDFDGFNELLKDFCCFLWIFEGILRFVGGFLKDFRRYFVHFEEDARVAVGESVAVGFSAVGHDRDLEITRFGRFGPGRVIAHVVGRFSRVLISCKMPLNLIEFY